MTSDHLLLKDLFARRSTDVERERRRRPELEQARPEVLDTSAVPISEHDIYDEVDGVVMAEQRSELQFALETVNDVERTEREIATAAADGALDQVIGIGVIMAITAC